MQSTVWLFFSKMLCYCYITATCCLFDCPNRQPEYTWSYHWRSGRCHCLVSLQSLAIMATHEWGCMQDWKWSCKAETKNGWWFSENSSSILNHRIPEKANNGSWHIITLGKVVDGSEMSKTVGGCLVFWCHVCQTAWPVNQLEHTYINKDITKKPKKIYIY